VERELFVDSRSGVTTLSVVCDSVATDSAENDPALVEELFERLESPDDK